MIPKISTVLAALGLCLLLGCAGDGGEQPCVPDCDSVNCGPDGCGSTCPDKCLARGLLCVDDDCAAPPRRCVAGDPTVEERELAEGWVHWPCPGTDACTGGRCRQLAPLEAGMYFGLSYVCFAPSADGVNDGILHAQVGTPVLEVPSEISMEVPSSRIIALVDDPWMAQGWPYAWEIGSDSSISLDFSFAEFASPVTAYLEAVAWCSGGCTLVLYRGYPEVQSVYSWDMGWSTSAYGPYTFNNDVGNWLFMEGCDTIRLTRMCLLWDN